MRTAPPVLVATALLALLAAVLGLSLGSRWTALDETGAIEIWAAEYVEETGGEPADCAAAPDERQGVWLVVICGSGSDRRVYPLDRRGRLIGWLGGAPSI